MDVLVGSKNVVIDLQPHTSSIKRLEKQSRDGIGKPMKTARNRFRKLDLLRQQIYRTRLYETPHHPARQKPMRLRVSLLVVDLLYGNENTTAQYSGIWRKRVDILKMLTSRQSMHGVETPTLGRIPKRMNSRMDVRWSCSKQNADLPQNRASIVLPVAWRDCESLHSWRN